MITDRPSTVNDEPAPARPSRPRGRPKGGRPLVAREEIVAAAIRAAQRIGPNLSMDAIAAEAGVSKPIVYRTIGSKDVVAEAVAEHLSLEIDELTMRILADSQGDTTAFAAATRAFFELIAERRELFLFVEHGWASNDGAQLARMIDRSAQPFIRHFAQQPDPAHPSPTADRTWAYAMVGAMRTVALMWVQDPYCDIDDLVDQMTTHHSRLFVTNPNPSP